MDRNGTDKDKLMKAMRKQLNVLDPLSPEGKPSMRQDMEAKRLSEVELFSGAVLERGRKYNVSTPVNEELYRRIKEIEAQY